MARKPPKYRRHSTRDLGFVEHAGKRTYFVGAFNSPESYEAYLAYLRAHGYLVYERGRVPAHGTTLGLLTDRFLQWAAVTYPGGRRSHCANLKDAVKKLLLGFGNMPATEFTPLRMKELQAWLISKGLARRTINDTTARVRLIFKWGVSEELVPVATYQALLTVPGVQRGRSGVKDPPPRRPVEWSRVEATLPKLNPTVRAMVRFHWLTGVRSRSICLARVEQFERSGKLWLWHPRHKTERLGHVLTVFVGPKAQKIVAPFLKGKSPSDVVFQPLNKSGQRSKRYRSAYDPDSYRKAVRRAAKKAKVAHWSPHQLRHARGTLVREKHGLEAAQAALGHARIDATQIYAQKQLALARMVAETMG